MINLIAKCNNCHYEKEDAWSIDDILKFECEECGETFCIECPNEPKTCKKCGVTPCDCLQYEDGVCENCIMDAREADL